MRIQRNQTSQRRGFTLIEVLLVLAIIGVIAAFAVPQLLGQQQEAMVDSTMIHIKNLEKAAMRYAVKHDGVYAGTIEELASTSQDRNGRELQPILSEEPVDAWGSPLNYEYPAEGNRQGNVDRPAIWSNGADGIEGNDDDVINWGQNL